MAEKIDAGGAFKYNFPIGRRVGSDFRGKYASLCSCDPDD